MPPPGCPDREQLAGYLLGNLPEGQSEAIARHVGACPECEATVSSMDFVADTVVAGLRRPPVQDPFAGEAEYRRAAAAVRGLGPGSPDKLPVAAKRDAAEPVAAKSQPSVLGQYRLLARLGEGGMGTVYRALHTGLDKEVAVKILPAQLMRDDRAIARFRREMRAVGKLEHPNLVRAMDAGQHHGTYYLAMELIDGPNLAQLVGSRGPLPMAEACELIRHAALGLQHAHEHGLVHRDIKPSNLILSQQGRVKVLDLGLALLRPKAPGSRTTAAYQGGTPDPPAIPPLPTGMTSAGVVMGTVDYIAPEQVTDSHHVDIRADIYSLGCTLYELLAGQSPFRGVKSRMERMMAHVREPVPPVAQLRPQVPPELSAVLNRMLAKDPDQRFATPQQVADALGPFCAGADLQRLLGTGTAPVPTQATQSTAPPTSGVTVMSKPTAVWYIPGEGNQRQGPFTTEQIVEAWQQGRLAADTLCWQEGMSTWLPLAQVQPFSTIFRTTQPPVPKAHWFRRIAATFFLLACFGGLGFGGYYLWTHGLGERLLGQKEGAGSDVDEATLLKMIEKADGGQQRLELCQSFVNNFPDSSDRPQVLVCMLEDAGSVYGEPGSLTEADPKKAEQFNRLAVELIAKHPKEPGAADAVLKLVSTFEANEAYGSAADTAAALLDKSAEGEIVLDAKAAVQLPKLIDRCIEKELKVEQMVDPSLVYALQANPRRCHVVSVDPTCLAEKFKSNEVELLKKWVAGGGILWATNDVLKLLDVNYNYERYRSFSGVCKPATAGDVCPILAGCKSVRVSYPRVTAFDLKSDQQVYRLLTSGTGSAVWSIVPYGRGFISDVKTVDTSTYDGAQFLRNFRRFCLRRIPVWASGPGSEAKAVPTREVEIPHTADLPVVDRSEPGGMKAEAGPADRDMPQDQWLAFIYQQEDRAERLKWGRQFLTTFPDSQTPEARKVLLLVATNVPEDGRERVRLCRLFLERFPDSPEAAEVRQILDAEAASLMQLVKESEAGSPQQRQHVEAYLETFPERPDCEDLLIRLIDETKDPAGRVAYAQKYLDRFPEGSHCRQALKTLVDHTPKGTPERLKWCKQCMERFPEAPDHAEMVLILARESPAGSEARLRYCRDYLAACTDDSQRAEVLSIIVGDASAALGGRAVDPQAAQPFLDAARELLEKHAQAKDVDKQVLDLALCLEKGGLTDDAFALAVAIRRTVRPPSPYIVGDLRQLINRVGKATVASTPEQLDQALAGTGELLVLWVQLQKDQLNAQQLAALKSWIESGGLLWVDTDLGREFGFQLAPAPSSDGPSTGLVPQDEQILKHPILGGLAANSEVGYSLSADGLLINGMLQDLKHEMTPLLGRAAGGGTTRVWVACAVRSQGRGFVVYRPRKFDADANGRQFAENLRRWSFENAGQ